MRKEDPKYSAFLSILREELVPAMGCTEPISVAYAAAKAREVLGCIPDIVVIGCSGSIIKNVKSVVVPNTGGLKGLEAAAAAGIIAGDANRSLEVIAGIRPSQRPEIRDYLERAKISIEHIAGERIFEIRMAVFHGDDSAVIRITDTHTNITLIEKNGRILSESSPDASVKNALSDRRLLNVADIYDFAVSLDPPDVQEMLSRQVDYNMAIAEEGLRNSYGANIGKPLLRFHGGDNASVDIKARAWAAAGSDARMHGCNLPVVINSGSGNQGITVSVPVVIYARETGAPDELLYRSLALSNLIAIQQKHISALFLLSAAQSAQEWAPGQASHFFWAKM